VFVVGTWIVRKRERKKERESQERERITRERERFEILVPHHTLVSHWIVHVALKLPTMHLTNGVTLKFNERTILQNLCKDRDYFLHFKKIGTNVQNGYKDRDQNAYSLELNVILKS